MFTHGLNDFLSRENSCNTSKSLNIFVLFAGSGALRGSYRSSLEPETEQSYTSLPRAAVYVFVDKAQIKGIKVESHPKVDFIPVEYPDTRKLRNSFKKLLRACHPSSVPQVQ